MGGWIGWASRVRKTEQRGQSLAGDEMMAASLVVLTNVCDGRNLFGREARKCIKAQFSLGGESNQELAATLESFR